MGHQRLATAPLCGFGRRIDHDEIAAFARQTFVDDQITALRIVRLEMVVSQPGSIFIRKRGRIFVVQFRIGDL
jgi:hypothetical protein